MHDQWTSFFVVEAGAAAALTGLLFVAVSINLAEIAREPVLAGRAGETIAFLTGALLAASLMVLPDQDAPWLGVEVLVVAAATWAVSARSEWTAWHVATGHARRMLPARLVTAQLATIPLIVGGVLLLTSSSAGFAFVAFGVLAAFVVSIFNGWVLLVEILR